MSSYSKNTGYALTGLASIIADTNTLNGSGTLFDSELSAGMFVDLENEFFKVVSVTSNTVATVEPVSSANVASEVARIRATPAWMEPEDAEFVRYYENTQLSDPDIRAMGIKAPGWVSYKTHTTAQGTRRRVETIATINDKFPDVLRKDRIIMLGASLTEYSFGNANNGSTELKASLNAVSNFIGFSGEVVGRGVAGENLADIIARVDYVMDEFFDTSPNNLWVLHVGGNDVSSRRPYVEADDYDHFWSQLLYLYNTLTANGDECVIMPLSKRLYQSAPAVDAANSSTDDNGSLPYNENIYLPFAEMYTPNWMNADGTHKLDFYHYVERNQLPYLVDTDGVHPHMGSYVAMQQFVLGNLWASSKGMQNTISARRGKSYLVSTSSAYPTYADPFNVNFVRHFGQGANVNQGDGASCGLIEYVSGEWDPFIEVSLAGWRGFNTAPDEAWAIAHITDTRLHANTLFAESSYLDGTTNTGSVIINNLVEGETGTLTLVASRAAADSNRQATVYVNGVQANTVLDAANNAAANDLVLDFTVGANGTIHIDFEKVGTFAYLNGLMIDFD